MSEAIDVQTVELVPHANGAPPAPAPQVQAALPGTASYIKGFEGMAMAPFSEKELAVLNEAVDPKAVEIKPDGIVYLPGVHYRQRLHRAFGQGAWALAPRGPIRSRPAANGGEMVTYHGALFVHGRFVAEAVGECTYWPQNAGMTYASAAEGAKTDCLGRCSKDLGIGWELFDPAWRREWIAKHAVQVWCENQKDGKKKPMWRLRTSPPIDQYPWKEQGGQRQAREEEPPPAPKAPASAETPSAKSARRSVTKVVSGTDPLPGEKLAAEKFAILVTALKAMRLADVYGGTEGAAAMQWISGMLKRPVARGSEVSLEEIQVLIPAAESGEMP